MKIPMEKSSVMVFISTGRYAADVIVFWRWFSDMFLYEPTTFQILPVDTAFSRLYFLAIFNTLFLNYIF